MSIFRHYFCTLSFLVFTFYTCSAQRGNIVNEEETKVTWCAVRFEEMAKCNSFARAVERDKYMFGRDFIKLECSKGANREDCMQQVDRYESYVTSLDAGEVFVGGRYHSLVPILQEYYTGNKREYYAVAVVKKGALKDVTNLRHLRGKKACFTGVGSLAGWVIPINVLMKRGGLEMVDCNNHVKNAIIFFGPSCAVNSLLDKYNPIGDNSDKLCQLCAGKVGEGKCTDLDPYAYDTGAFRCLLEAGDIAFLRHSTVSSLTAEKNEFPTVTRDDFELLCTDGSRRSVDDYESCNWGWAPANSIVTSSATSQKTRRQYQKFFQKAVQMYGGEFKKNDSYLYHKYVDTNRNNRVDSSYNYNPYTPYTTTTTTTPRYPPDDIDQTVEKFHLFESYPRYGFSHNNMFTDLSEGILALEESRQMYTAVLASSLDLILEIRHCPVQTMTLCVTSEAELIKCIRMRTALKAQLIKPEMLCYKGFSHIHCMQSIKNGDADVSVFDAGDVYTAGLHYDLIPFISEVYNLGEPEYYAVAVAKEQDPSTDLTFLRGKYSCHPGVNTAAGWIVPLAFLLSNGWMRGYGCDSMRAAAEFFGKACAPGAVSSEYNTGVPYDNMCHLCHGSSFSYCRRDASEDFFGVTGAFRCLVEGGGEVAFVRHTTVMENTGGKKRKEWVRNTLSDDFELLCPEGVRAPVWKYKSCNLGKVKANAIMTRGGEGYNEQQLNAYINLFTYAQQFYGRKDQDDFSFAMFYSAPPFSDLIFQDATTQLKIIPPSQREYSAYLGQDFMRAKRIVDCFASASSLSSPVILLSLVIIAQFF